MQVNVAAASTAAGTNPMQDVVNIPTELLRAWSIGQWVIDAYLQDVFLLLMWVTLWLWVVGHHQETEAFWLAAPYLAAEVYKPSKCSSGAKWLRIGTLDGLGLYGPCGQRDSEGLCSHCSSSRSSSSQP